MAKNRDRHKPEEEKVPGREAVQKAPMPDGMLNLMANVPSMGDAIKTNIAKQQQYAPINSLMQKLPDNATWTRDERSRWITGLTAMLDLCIDVVEKGER